MNKFVVKLKCGNHAIIQSRNLSDPDNVKARIGIILPNKRCIEFLNLDNWIASYQGSCESVKISLIEIYNKNKLAIKKNIMAFKTVM